jgi:serine/threonine-protein kinase
MGAVWLADHLGLRTKVVVKFLVEEMSHNADAISRFTREAAAASQVKSPHVVQMIDHGVTAGGLAYIAMERLEGYSLAEHLARENVVAPHQVALVISQAAKALSRAHEAKVVHRDIKPDNLFLCDDGSGEAFVKVLDFGIAKVVDKSAASSTRTGVMVGTVYYMSPEQVVGHKDLDHRADIWALAVVAYEMLTGIKPFEGETLGAISIAICAAKFHPVLGTGSSVPAEVDAVFAKAFSADIAARYPTMRAFADDLTRACGGVAPLVLLTDISPPRSVSDSFVQAATEHSAAHNEGPVSVPTRSVPAPGQTRASRRTPMLAVIGLLLVTVVAMGVWIATRASGTSTASPALRSAVQPVAALPAAPPSLSALPDDPPPHLTNPADSAAAALAVGLDAGRLPAPPRPSGAKAFTAPSPPASRQPAAPPVAPAKLVLPKDTVL